MQEWPGFTLIYMVCLIKSEFTLCIKSASFSIQSVIYTDTDQINQFSLPQGMLSPHFKGKVAPFGVFGKHNTELVYGI